MAILFGKYPLLVGVPCRRTHVVPWSWINSSPAGALIIDPTTNAATNEDVRLYDAGNYGTDTKLAVGKFPNTGNWKSRSIINFSLTGIPSNATVLNAQMKLKYYEKYNNTTGTWVDRWIQAHQLLLGWDEAQADSLERSTGVNWAAARGKIGGTNPDANGAYESTLLIVEDEALPVWKSWDLTALTQKWVSGAVANYGVILWATNENTSGYVLRFYSSEATNTSDRPYLEVIWSQTPQTVYFLKDHLGSIRAAVSDSGKAATVIGFDDYDAWGYPLALRTKAIPNAYLQGASKSKFTGNEWDDDYGLNLYHLGARDYDPLIGRSLTVDRFSIKYPSLTPYHYAANNPILFVDVNGDSIWINDNGTNFLYTTGMKYAGKDKNVAGLVRSLNRLATVKAGNKVLSSLIGSTANYNVSFNASLSTPGAFSSQGSNPGGSISLNPGSFDFGAVAHEVFHGYQQEQGSWGRSIMSETEADLFSGTMRIATGDKNVIFGNPNAGFAGANYERAMQSLVKSFDESTFWNDAVYQFKTGSALNWRNRYDQFRDTLPHQKILINNAYPLLRRR